MRRESESVRREAEGQRQVEMDDAGDDHPAGGDDHGDPQPQHDLGDVGDLPVQREDEKRADSRGGQLHLERGHRGPEDLQVLHQADVTAGDFQRSGKQQLPDEQKRQQASPPARPEAFPQKDVRTAGSRQRRAEFGHHQPVRHGDDHADDPDDDPFQCLHDFPFVVVSIALPALHGSRI